MALLHGLVQLGFRNLTACHLDHRLRGRDSAADALFVRRSAGRLGIGLESARADTPAFSRKMGLSAETAARELRYAFFGECAKRTGIRRLLLAHHADDQIETVLFNFLRGTGAAGLAGMRPNSRRGNIEIIRPLLAVRRSEIDTFVKGSRIAFREDATNSEPSATRNRLRSGVIPAIGMAFGPSAGDAILRAANILAAEEDWMADEAARFGGGPTLSVTTLKSAPLALRRRAIRLWLMRAGIAEAGFAEVEGVIRLLHPSGQPAKVNLPGGKHARRREGIIFLEGTD